MTAKYEDYTSLFFSRLTGLMSSKQPIGETYWKIHKLRSGINNGSTEWYACMFCTAILLLEAKKYE